MTTTIKDIILHIVNKNDNNIYLNNLEKYLLDIYINNLTNLIKDNILTIDINIFFENIKTKLINNNTHIIKFIFSNNNYIYVDKKILLTIEYFKIMFDSCNNDNNLICDIKVNEHYDNFEIFQSIILFAENGKYENVNTIKQLINMMDIINYFGNIWHNGNNIMDIISTNMLTIKCEDININTIEHIYIILKNYNVNNIDVIIQKLWKLCDDNTNIENLTFFSEIALNTSNGKLHIIDNNCMQYYEKIFVHVNTDNKHIIINNLLKNNTKISYDIIIKIRNDIYVNMVDDILISLINNISELIFDYDISIFSDKLQTLLELKFDKIDLVNKRFENIDINKHEKTIITALLDFSRKNNSNEEETRMLQNSIGYFYKPCIIKTIIPFSCYRITGIGNVSNINNDNTICVNISVPSGEIVDINTEILYSNNKNKMNMFILKQILIPYKINNEDKTIICNGIVGGHAYFKYTQKYIFVVENTIDNLKNYTELYIVTNNV